MFVFLDEKKLWKILCNTNTRIENVFYVNDENIILI